mgnify:CR=1 FL=1
MREELSSTPAMARSSLTPSLSRSGSRLPTARQDAARETERRAALSKRCGRADRTPARGAAALIGRQQEVRADRSRGRRGKGSLEPMLMRTKLLEILAGGLRLVHEAEVLARADPHAPAWVKALDLCEQTDSSAPRRSATSAFLGLRPRPVQRQEAAGSNGARSGHGGSPLSLSRRRRQGEQRGRRPLTKPNGP